MNRLIRGRSAGSTAEEALRGFGRFPAWMWQNSIMVDFVRPGPARQTGFYGLDLYSLYRSMYEVISYLQRVDPAAAQRARQRYSCFDHFAGDEGQAYGFAAAFGVGDSCEQHVVDQLIDLQQPACEYLHEKDLLAEDELFYAQQNAPTVKDAEEYYRALFKGRVTSWNLRDRHMVETLEALSGHLSQHRGEPAKLVVWAHNCHVGDARATEAGARRAERGAAELCHEVSKAEFFLSFPAVPEAADVLHAPRLQGQSV